MRDPNRLHKPQHAEPPGWNNMNNDAFQVLMEMFRSFFDQNKKLFQTLERRLENIENILEEFASKYHGESLLLIHLQISKVKIIHLQMEKQCQILKGK